MDRNTVTNLIPDVPRPLSLEEAIAMAPPEASSPFAASTAAITWGAVRSGQSVWEFLIGMTREFEEKLQASYEAWKAENAWYPAGFARADGEAVVSEESASADPVSDTADNIVTTGTAEDDPAPASQSVANDTASGPVDKTVKSIDTEPEKSAELRTILESLPKDPDPTLYAAILADRDRESLMADVKAMIDRRKRIHRPRTALTAFLNWLEGLA
ncbi:MAG: hypothetical protein IJ088_02770 [Clostridia bacterium]|nr:hypothetical protein [Clostridia bacterium]